MEEELINKIKDILQMSEENNKILHPLLSKVDAEFKGEIERAIRVNVEGAKLYRWLLRELEARSKVEGKANK